MDNKHANRDIEQMMLFYLCDHQGQSVSIEDLLCDARIGVRSKEVLIRIARSLEARNLIEIGVDGSLEIA